jgi:hypothetical protein
MLGTCVRLSLALGAFGLIGCAIGAEDVDQPEAKRHRECETRTPTAAEAVALEAMVGDADTVDEQLIERSFTIPVAVHVITSNDGRGDVSDDMIAAQIDVMNEAFSGATGGVNTRFSFELASTDRTANSDWYHVAYGSQAEVDMKNMLRTGGADTLNMYFADLGDGLLGWATFPSDYQAEPKMDGVVILSSSLPGGNADPYNLGDTATHEVGHWVGLYHTFQNGCTAPGDLVKDTPRVANPNFGSPEPGSIDSCPSDPGQPARPDPTDNFMDYVDDIAMYAFTPKQGSRARTYHARFRDGL